MTAQNPRQNPRGLGGFLESDFLKPRNIRSQNKKSNQTKQLATDIQDIFLDRSNSKRTKNSVRVLQDAIILADVIDRLQNLSSCHCSKPVETKAYKSYATKSKIVKRTRPKIHTRKIAPTKNNISSVAVKKQIKGSTTLKSTQLLFDSGVKFHDVKPEPPTIFITAEPEKLNLTENNNTFDLSSSQLSISTQSSFSEKDSSDDNATLSPVFPESHTLEPNYANRLRRRQAMARRKPRSINTGSIELKEVPFREGLPLDEKFSSKFFRKCIGLLSSSSPKEKEIKKDKRRNYIQRSYLPVQLIENIPASEQIRSFINISEVEAYRKSGMTFLNLDDLDSKAYKESMRAKHYKSKPAIPKPGPSSAETFHDIWYEDLSPPPDAVSVYVYWWGYEVYIPTEVLKNLQKQGSVTNSTLSFISILLTSVPLIQPFIKLLTAFISMESSASNLFHSPQGTVLTAIWILPFLIVPRSWY